MREEEATVWVHTVIIECPFCEESIINPETGEESWHSGDFLMAGDVIPVVHSPCDRLYEVSNPFEEPLPEIKEIEW